MKELTINIDADGNVAVEANNFKGKTCEEATKFLVDALGKKVDMKTKPEFFQKAEENVHVRRG